MTSGVASRLTERFFLGLPAWAYPGWKDSYFVDRPSRLASYATVFGTVEGNTTFYRVPDASTVRRWRDAVDGTPFRFCFKLPREVTHERVPSADTLHRFVAAMEPLSANLGPFLLQFPATVSPEDLMRFDAVFDAVSALNRFVIEVRHPGFFDDPDALGPALARWQADRVVFDSRPLFQGDLSHPDALAARHEKPDVPVVDRTPNGVTMVRLILHPALDTNDRWLDDWAERTAEKLLDGGTVYMMIHCPNNQHCPALAETFDRKLRERLPAGALAPLPPWPVPQQQTLLGDFIG
ncbi:MAG: DUF72 domain-containing protein [Pseudomonadota bacterium]